MMTTQRTERRRPGRGGYLLLTVMVTIVIAGLLLTGVARRSLSLAAEAHAQQERLQLRWGMLSGERALLRAAPRIFNDLQELAEERRAAQRGGTREWVRPPAEVRAIVRLGELQFGFTLADENAKVNLNSVYHYRGESGVERLLSGSASPWRGGLRLRPEVASLDLGRSDPDEEGDDGRPIAFRSWGQVLDLSPPQVSASALAATLAGNMTCWGSGRLNIVRAGEQSIEQVGELAVTRGKIQELIRRRRQHPDQELPHLIDQLGLTPIERYRLEDLLTEQSSCYSLWTTATTPRRSWIQLAVSQQIERKRSQTQTFVFW